MRLYAHRGASVEAPENTLAAFRLALDAGADGIELDVHVSADGVPVVIHDDRLERTTSGRGTVGDMTVDELQRLDAGEGEWVPTLGEVIELVGGRMLMDIEIKAPGVEAVTLASLAALEYDQWVVSSFDWDVLRNVRRMAPRAELWPLTWIASDEAVAVALEIEAPLLALRGEAIDEDIATFLTGQDLGFMAWTVNDPRQALTLEAFGATAICTDDPRRIRSAVGSR